MGSKWQAQLPMVATYFRIAITPVLVTVLFYNHPWSGWVAAILFVVGSWTDWLDGFWARKFNAQSVMGQLMDPIADKILVLGALVMLLYQQKVDPFMVLLLISRDIFIGGIRSVAASNNVIIAAKPFGKWKTAIQMLAIPCICLFSKDNYSQFYHFGYDLLWVSVILSMISGVQYTYGYYRGRKSS